MTDALPMPLALRLVVHTDEEWAQLEPFLKRGKFPRGVNSWLLSDEIAAQSILTLVELCEARLTEGLARGDLRLAARPAGAHHFVTIETKWCRRVEIIGEDGADLHIDGLEYHSARLTKSVNEKDVGKAVEKHRAEADLRQSLKLIVEDLESRHGQTRWSDLVTTMKVRHPDLPITESMIKRCARAAGIEEWMITRGRPKKNEERGKL